jgi:hypothetical protein
MKSGDFTRLLETEVSFWMLKQIILGNANLAAAELCGFAVMLSESQDFDHMIISIVAAADFSHPFRVNAFLLSWRSSSRQWWIFSLFNSLFVIAT